MHQAFVLHFFFFFCHGDKRSKRAMRNEYRGRSSKQDRDVYLEAIAVADECLAAQLKLQV